MRRTYVRTGRCSAELQAERGAYMVRSQEAEKGKACPEYSTEAAGGTRTSVPVDVMKIMIMTSGNNYQNRTTDNTQPLDDVAA